MKKKDSQSSLYRNIRESLGLNVWQFNKLIGISIQRAARLDKIETKLDPDMVHKLWKASGQSAEAFIELCKGRVAAIRKGRKSKDAKGNE